MMLAKRVEVSALGQTLTWGTHVRVSLDNSELQIQNSAVYYRVRMLFPPLASKRNALPDELPNLHDQVFSILLQIVSHWKRLGTRQRVPEVDKVYEIDWLCDGDS
jgi:hypothetical protein